MEYKKEMIEILTQPIIPIYLHGVNPRSIMGDNRWNKIKKEVQKEANHHCMICGDFVSHKHGDWLNTHEIYEYDYDNFIQKLNGYVGICTSCHEFIHQGHLNIQYHNGFVSEEERNAIIKKGNELLSMFGLKKENMPDDVLKNKNWKLLFENNFYQKDADQKIIKVDQ